MVRAALTITRLDPDPDAATVTAAVAVTVAVPEHAEKTAHRGVPL